MWLQYLHFCIGSPNLQRCQSIRVFLLRRSIFWFANMSKTRHCHFLNKTISDLNCMYVVVVALRARGCKYVCSRSDTNICILFLGYIW